MKADCFNCQHYRQSQLENECMATDYYCYTAHKINICEYFEPIDESKVVEWGEANDTRTENAATLEKCE